MNLIHGILRTYLHAYVLASPPSGMRDKGLWPLYACMFVAYFIAALSWHLWLRPDPVHATHTWWLISYLALLPLLPASILGGASGWCT